MPVLSRFSWRHRHVLRPRPGIAVLAAPGATCGRGPACLPLDRGGDEVAVLRPAAVVVLHVRDAQQVFEHEPGVARSFADAAVGDRGLVLYQQWDAVAIAVAGFTPIPFKIFTIAAGLFEINLITFVVVVVLSRGARFFLLGGLIWWFGPSIQNFVDRYFNLLVILFSILLVGGFFIVRYAL